MLQTCPLCEHPNIRLFSQDKRREYFECIQCHLVFVARHDLISLEQEKAIYDSHENNVEDLGYQTFLSRAVNPLLRSLDGTSSGLDFGCGPGPALAKMLMNEGHQVSLYDIFYYPDTQVLNCQYDFITCTEVIEHVAEPKTVWQQLVKMLKPNGILVVMTKLVINQERFKNWHYKNDITHINFFSKCTFKLLAESSGLSLTFYGDDVMLFKKTAIV